MTVQEWLRWKKNTVDLESWMGYPIPQDYECLHKMFKTWLIRLKLETWATKRRLNGTVDRADDETKGKLYNSHLAMGNEDEIDLEDIDIAELLSDVLESLLQECNSIFREERSAPKASDRQEDSMGSAVDRGKNK